MRFLKALSIIFTLFILSACQLGAINSGNPFHSQSNLVEKDHALIYKEIPARFIIDPLPANTDIDGKAAILINAITGDILFEKNSDESLPIASMSKIMSELLVLEALEEERIEWDDIVPISDYAYRISNYPGYASVKLQQDYPYTVKELVHAMALRSDNGATIALAELVSGSEQAFVTAMNDKAEQLGLTKSDFFNSSGLTNEDLLGYHSTGELSDTNLMSASDLAALSSHLISHFPHLLNITQQTSITFHDVEYANTNWMLPGVEVDLISEDVTFHGVDGLKTGHTNEAGYCFAGTAQINDVRVISVIMGTDEIGQRFLDTKVLYEAVEAQ